MTNSLDDYNDILSPDESLAGYTWLKLGGKAERFYTPTSRDQLIGLAQACVQASIPFRVLGGGSNLLVPDGGVSGAVIRVIDPLLSSITVDGDEVVAEGGALLSRLVTEFKSIYKRSIKNGAIGAPNLAMVSIQV